MTLLSAPSEDKQVLICTIEDTRNGTLDSFKWKKNDAEVNDYIQSAIQKVGSLHKAVSVMKAENKDWDSKSVYTCEATYGGKIYVQKIYKGTVTMPSLLNSDIK